MAELPFHADDSQKPKCRVRIRFAARDVGDPKSLIKELAKQFPIADIDAEFVEIETLADEVLETQVHRVAQNLLDKLDARQSERAATSGGNVGAGDRPPRKRRWWSLTKVLWWFGRSGWRVTAEIGDFDGGVKAVSEVTDSIVNASTGS